MTSLRGRQCESMVQSDRQCLVRVVRTDPWLVCESGGVRFVLPAGLAGDGRLSDGGWLHVPEWVFDDWATGASGAGGNTIAPGGERPLARRTPRSR
jgi:hypothetical protein